MKNLLPIGSVVLLKESTHRIMITGRVQRQEGTEIIWDYCACLYPEGIVDPRQMFLFNHEQIEAVFFIGFQDKEELDYKKEILSKYEKDFQ